MLDSHLNPDDWSKDASVFPPIDHENLQILSSEDHNHDVPHSPPSSSHLRGWITIALQTLRSKVSSFRNRGPIWSIGLPAAALLMSCCWIFIAIRKKRTLTPNVNQARLIDIIKDKDGKIAQLLHQIAEMNEILIDRHKSLAAKLSDRTCTQAGISNLIKGMAGE